MDSEKFLKVKKWQDCFNSISNIELRITAIFTILNCPNQTCRKSLLHERILYFLKVRTSQNPKEEFRKSIDKIISQLIASKVFKEYNKGKEHPRVKFDKTKTDIFEDYLRKYFKSEITKDIVQTKVNNKSFSVSSGNSNFSLFDQNLYPHHEIINKDVCTSFIEKDEESEKDYWTENENDEVEEDLLDRFINETLPELDNRFEEILTPKTHLNIKENIVNHFLKSSNIQIEEDFSEIRIRLMGNIESLVTIEIDLISNCLYCNVVLEYLTESINPILKSISKNYSNTTFCIDDYNGKESFFLKQRIDISRYNTFEVKSIVESLLKTTRIVTSIIEKHL